MYVYHKRDTYNSIVCYLSACLNGTGCSLQVVHLWPCVPIRPGVRREVGQTLLPAGTAQAQGRERPSADIPAQRGLWAIQVSDADSSWRPYRLHGYHRHPKRCL